MNDPAAKMTLARGMSVGVVEDHALLQRALRNLRRFADQVDQLAQDQGAGS